MGIVPDIPICREIVESFRSLGENLHSHFIMQKVVSTLMYVNYYVQLAYGFVYTKAVDFYYSNINTDYERVDVFTNKKTDINTLIYSNHKTSTYRTIMSNHLNLLEYNSLNEETRELVNKIIELKNPILSAIMTISNPEFGFEQSIEINKVLAPFLFPGNVIEGNPEFVSYLIHEYVNDVKETTTRQQVCPVIENSNSIEDYQIDISYMTLNDVGLMTIPYAQRNHWTLTVNDQNDVLLDIKEKEE